MEAESYLEAGTISATKLLMGTGSWRFLSAFFRNSMGLHIVENSILPHSSLPSKHMTKLFN